MGRVAGIGVKFEVVIIVGWIVGVWGMSVVGRVTVALLGGTFGGGGCGGRDSVVGGGVIGFW